MSQAHQGGGRFRALGRVLLRSEARADARHEWRRRLLGEPALSPCANLLVLCHGNICRSPFAEALLRTQAGLRVRSAGLEAGEGNPADGVAMRVAREFGVELEAHRSHRVSVQELSDADLVLVMEGHQADAVIRRAPAAKPHVRLLGDFLDAPPFRLADPWGRPEGVYREVFSRIRRASERLGGALALAGDASSGDQE